MVLTINDLCCVGKENANAKATAPLSPDIHITVYSLSYIFHILLRFVQLAKGNIARAREINNPKNDLFKVLGDKLTLV